MQTCKATGCTVAKEHHIPQLGIAECTVVQTSADKKGADGHLYSLYEDRQRKDGGGSSSRFDQGPVQRPGERLWPAHRYTVTVILHLAHISPASFVHFCSLLLPIRFVVNVHSDSLLAFYLLLGLAVDVADYSTKRYMRVEFCYLVDIKRCRNQWMHIDRAIVIGMHTKGMMKENKAGS